MSESRAEVKMGKVIYFMENVMEVEFKHDGGYTTLRLDIWDMPVELREKISAGDEEVYEQLENYLDDYYANAEIDGISMTRGDCCENSHRWREIFSYCGAVRSAVVKARGAMVRLINCV
jgi:hypothetical protein